MSNKIEKMIAQTFQEIAQGLETGSFGEMPKIAVAGMDSEHGEGTMLQGAKSAAQNGIQVVYIGRESDGDLINVNVNSSDESHKKMDELMENNEVDAAVTMHYPFPIGVSTIGRVVAPGTGKKIYIASTTGTSATDRVESMVKNAVSGIIAAKACGIKEPTVGILNIDGARQTEGILKELSSNGYKINFAQSARADGGCVLRGNDLLTGSCDVCVTDSLTGNILVKMMSAFTTGGSYESLGDGYGPGIGVGYDKLVMIISRASGAPVLSGAIQYAAELVKGDWKAVSKAEHESANKAGLKELINQYKARFEQAKPKEEEKIVMPEKEVVTSEISGIEILDLEDAVSALWKIGIYAQSGMGCTGPIILVNPKNFEKAVEYLKEEKWLSLN